jgi:hypothetical protein
MLKKLQKGAKAQQMGCKVINNNNNNNDDEDDHNNIQNWNENFDLNGI